jgi:hypothetical protein
MERGKAMLKVVADVYEDGKDVIERVAAAAYCSGGVDGSGYCSSTQRQPWRAMVWRGSSDITTDAST